MHGGLFFLLIFGISHCGYKEDMMHLISESNDLEGTAAGMFCKFLESVG